jgi:hypothetical protein
MAFELQLLEHAAAARVPVRGNVWLLIAQTSAISARR